MITAMCVLPVMTTLLWAACFGARRATIHSREMEADIRRTFGE